MIVSSPEPIWGWGNEDGPQKQKGQHTYVCVY